MSFSRAWAYLKLHNEIFFALLMTVLFMLPRLFIPWHPQSLPEIYPFVASDETHYIATINEALTGNWRLGNTFLLEEKQGLSHAFIWTSAIALAGLAKIWPGDLVIFVLLMKMLGFLSSVYLLLMIMRQLLPSLPFNWRAASVMGFFTFASVIGPHFFPHLWQTISLQAGWSEDLVWFRFINPVVTGPIMLAGIYNSIRLWQKPSYKRVIVVALILIVLALSYIFLWIFLATFLAILTIMLWLSREARLARYQLIALTVGIAGSLPYLLYIRQQMNRPEFIYLSALRSHAPVFELTIIASTIVFLAVWIFVRWREGRMSRLLPSEATLLTLTLSILATVNHQIITGQSLEPHHFYYITDRPIASLLLIIALGLVVSRWRPRLSTCCGWLMVALTAWTGLAIELSTLTNRSREYQDLQRLAPALTWIKQQKLPLVVLANDQISELIPVYTSADVAFATHAGTYGSTGPARRQWAWFVRSRLAGVKLDQAKQLFTRDREIIANYLFSSQYYRQRCGTRGCFPDSIIDKLVADYEPFLTKPFTNNLKQYRVDVILWDEKNNPEWHLWQMPDLDKVWEQDGMSLWQINPSYSPKLDQ